MRYGTAITLVFTALILCGLPTVTYASQPETEYVPSPLHDVIAPDAYLHFVIGYQAELLGDLKTAADEYRLVIRADRSSAYVRTQLAGVLMKLERHEEAEDVVKEALALEPENIEALTMLAQVLNSQKKSMEAIEVYERVIKADPGNDSLRLHLSVLLASTGDLDRAEDVIEPASDDVIRASGYYYIGVLASGMDKLKLAKRALKKSIEINPALDASYQYLGIIEQKDGKFRKAEQYYLKALEINHVNSGVLENLSQLYMDTDKPEKALEMELELSKIEPGNADPMRKMGLIHMNLQQFEQAAVQFEKVLELEPNDMEFRYYLAAALEEMQRFEEALGQHQILIERDPVNTKVLLNIGYLYSALGQDEKAAETYEKLISIKQDVPDFYVYLARNYINTERKEDALRVLNNGLALFEDNAEMHFTMSIYHERFGNFDDMVEHLKRAIEIDPRHAEALNFLGYSYAEKSINLKEALDLVKESLSLKPGNGYITDSLGWVYYKMGNYKKALKVLKKATGLVQDDPVIFEHLGDAYKATGDSAKAKEAWLRALESKEKAGLEEGIHWRIEQKIRDLEDQ